MMDDQDTLYTRKYGRPFAFDAEVTPVFADMIQRSVPGYGLTLQMIALIAGQYGQAHSNLYDLGCSLGASTLAMAHGLNVDGCTVIGVDQSQAMLEACAENVRDCVVPIVLQHADIEHVVFENASMVVLNFTLQFIAKDKRDALIQRIYRGMREGGVLILSEKVAFADSFEQAAQIRLHESFKRAQGYSELEVSRKRQSLENVLIPEQVGAHHARLARAGFAHSQTWFQCFNFVSMLAYK